MICDHCRTDTDCIIDAYYDLCLCTGCNARHWMRERFKTEALAELARDQWYVESIMLDYDYGSTW